MGMSIDSFKQAYNTPAVQTALKHWNSWKNTQANLFSEDASKMFEKFPGVGDKYSKVREAVLDATGGFAASAGLTKVLRYEKPAEKLLNPLIQKGVETTAKAGSYVNDRIDDFVESHRQDTINKEVELNNDETKIKKAPIKDTSKRGYEDFGIKEQDGDSQGYYPGSKTMSRYGM